MVSRGRNHSSRNHSSTPASTASLSIGRGDVVRTARVPLLYPCRYVRKKLSVRESDRRCSPLAFCPRRISVGRAHHYRKRMYSIRRFRTKLTFRRNILLLFSLPPSFFVFFVLSSGGWVKIKLKLPHIHVVGRNHSIVRLQT